MAGLDRAGILGDVGSMPGTGGRKKSKKTRDCVAVVVSKKEAREVRLAKRKAAGLPIAQPKKRKVIRSTTVRLQGDALLGLEECARLMRCDEEAALAAIIEECRSLLVRRRSSRKWRVNPALQDAVLLEQMELSSPPPSPFDTRPRPIGWSVPLDPPEPQVDAPRETTLPKKTAPPPSPAQTEEAEADTEPGWDEELIESLDIRLGLLRADRLGESAHVGNVVKIDFVGLAKKRQPDDEESP